MPGALDLIVVVARFVHIASACLLTGVFAFQVLVTRPARERFVALDRRLLALAAGALAAAMGTGFVDLARQAVVATGGGVAGSLVPQTIGALLGETRYGDIWLVRQMLWLLLAALLVLRGPERGPADWLALRLAGLVLAAASFAASAASGHAASAPERTTLSIAVDALHLLAAGVWAGALVPLILLLRAVAAGRPDAPPPLAAVVAVRRFSMLGLLCVAVMLASGAYAVLQQVGSMPALLGTTYGRWLVLKLALLVPLLVVALLNRAYLRPRLERAVAEADEREPGARALVAGLGRFVLLETLLAAAILGAVAVLGLTTPARHDPVAWPLSFRFAWELTIGLPGVWGRVVIGGAVAAVGVAASLALVTVRRRWWRPALLGGAAAVALGLAVAAPPIAVDAYPTTYVRPAVPYTADSIVRGQVLYREHCSRCHGARGAGDGPAAAGLTPMPADLTSRRSTDRTVGDLFWWVSHDVSGSATSARLTPEQRWDVVNFLRTLSAAEAARGLGPTVSVTPVVVAPDVRYTTGVSGERALRDQRGQTIVLLVFFRLPESLERLSRLSTASFDLRVLGVEVVAVPLEGARTLYRTLGPRPLLFPFVIDGAEDAVAAYQHFHPAAPRPVHMEMAIDRRGYLRAHWIPSGSPNAPGGWNDVKTLLQELTRLAGEPRAAPILGEHIH